MSLIAITAKLSPQREWAVQQQLRQNVGLQNFPINQMILVNFRGRKIEFPRRPLIMGIININDDSFSGDGTLDPSTALKTAKQKIEEGADIIDIGAESARTNRSPISVEEEIQRLSTFLEKWKNDFFDKIKPRDNLQIFPPILSVNTWRYEVAEFAIQNGCELLNDMGGASDLKNVGLCVESGCAYLLMHIIGLPKQNHSHIHHNEILDTLMNFFSEKIQTLNQQGLSSEQIILDPGIGFAKQPQDDIKICAFFSHLKKLKRPILLPLSRKGFIGRALNSEEAKLRDPGTIGAIVATSCHGAHLFRVHNVKATWQTLKTLSLFLNWENC
ncbi:MAG: dihydropteroate synthase [Chthoniobacterales bacterium]|nr:dihydropteroate synthase [Chthoniobacterales bacterium]